MNSSPFIFRSQACERWAWVLTGIAALYLTVSGVQTLLAAWAFRASPEFCLFLFTGCAISAGIGFRRRSVWQGVAVGSACALAIRLFLPPLSDSTSSFLGNAPDRYTSICLLPLCAGFWGGGLRPFLCDADKRGYRLICAAMCWVLGMGFVAFATRAFVRSSPVPHYSMAPRESIPPRKPLPIGHLAGLRFEVAGKIVRTGDDASDAPLGEILYLSPDGKVCVGALPVFTNHAPVPNVRLRSFLWTQAGGFTSSTAATAGGEWRHITGASADGSVVIGLTRAAPLSAPSMPEHQSVNGAGKRTYSYATHRLTGFIQDAQRNSPWNVAVSFPVGDNAFDPSHLIFQAVGPEGHDVFCTMNGKAYLWSRGNAAIALPDLEGAEFRMVGPMAAWCVGTHRGQAFLWGNAGGISRFAPLNPDDAAVAVCASADARFVAGTSGGHLCLWTGGNVKDLGDLSGSEPQPVPSLPNNFAGRTMRQVGEMRLLTSLNIANDGRTIAGMAGRQPFLWTASHGLMDMQALIADAGGNVDTLDHRILAVSLSPDGAFVNGISEGRDANLVRWRLYLKH